jgi:hypothetical protein
MTFPRCRCACEQVGLTVRLMDCVRAVGACAATLLAWWVPSWRLLTFLSGAACLAYLSTWSLVTESPQWLLLKGRKVRTSAALAHLLTCKRCVLLRQWRGPCEMPPACYRGITSPHFLCANGITDVATAQL